ncbi:MAG: dihydrofolate reductase [Clostridia bacterium]|nr:dihydrofolate reductase [Clostridia bacterium]
MSVSIIAAVGKNLELGKGNDLIWRFKEDMKFFKETTTGSTVIMGRKTFESLPRALPNRRNIVVSKNKSFKAEGAEVVCGVKEALELAGDDNIFVIGGAKIYEQFLSIADKLYLTEIDAECSDADVYFPEFDKSKYSKDIIKEYRIDGIDFAHVLYTKL